jgi:hypothetical protein
MAWAERWRQWVAPRSEPRRMGGHDTALRGALNPM